MRIIFIVPRFAPELGGVESHVKALSMELIKKGNSVTIITTTNDRSNHGSGSDSGIKIIRKFLSTRDLGGIINVFRNLLSMMLFIAANMSLILKHDVVHLHDSSAFLWVALGYFFVKKKLYITFHGYEGYPIKKRDIIIRRLAEKLTCGNICVGEFIKKWYGTEPTKIILGGISEPRQIVTERSIAALFIGRLAEDTSVRKYLECIKILQELFGKKLSLHICGDGPLLDSLITFAELNSLEVEFHGFVNDPHNFICKSTYVFASGYLAILEAMSYRRPVFSIYETPLKKDYYYSIPEVEKKMYVEESPEKLAKDLLEYDEVADKKKIDNAYEFAMSHRWEDVCEVYLKLWAGN